MKMKKIRGIAENARAAALYFEAFPPEERAPWLLLAKKARNANVDNWGIYADGRFAGLMYIVNHADLSYVFYFAVKKDFRGTGLGARALKLARKHYAGRRFFLEIESLDPAADNYDERVKLRDFYLRGGLLPMGMNVQEGSVVYELLGCGGKVAAEEYSALIAEYLGKTLFRGVTMRILPPEK